MKKSHSSHSNKIASALLRHVFIGCAALGLLTACGQRGSLYLPTAPEAAQRASILQTLSTPVTSDADKNSTSSTRTPMTPPAAK